MADLERAFFRGHQWLMGVDEGSGPDKTVAWMHPEVYRDLQGHLQAHEESIEAEMRRALNGLQQRHSMIRELGL
jgi:hypothetical protein